MIPQFFVFVDADSDPKHLAVIKGLLDHGYCPFVDSQKGNNEQWFTDNLRVCQHRLYYLVEDQTFSRSYEAGKFEKPDLLVAFSEGVEVSDEEWGLMNLFIHSLNCLVKTKIGEEDLKKFLDKFEKPLVVKPQQTKVVSNPDLPKSYGFRFASVGSVGFYEIVKPNVEEPYVTMVEDYKSFPMDMYTNFFKCQSWGVSNSDIGFLRKLWYHHGETGELDLEKEYELRVKRVVDGGKEPLVWRNTLENVMEIYTSTLDKVGDKRKRPDIEIQNKK